MSPSALTFRIIAVTLLAPLVAAIASAILLFLVVAIPLWSGSSDATLGDLVGGFGEYMVLAVMIGLMLFGLFAVAFVLLTQIPLTLLYRRSGFPGLAVHLFITILLGIGMLTLFITVTNAYNGPMAMGLRSRFYAGLFGIAGGLSVGLLWHLFILRTIFGRREIYG